MRETPNNVLTALSDCFLHMYLESQDDCSVKVGNDDTYIYSPLALGG